MSAARDREHDEWIPWYVEDTPGWLELSLAARGAMEGIARKLNRKTGQLALRRGLSSLAILLHVRWEELEPALAELIAKGKIEWDGSRFLLSDPEYTERKRRSGADRMADSRARKKDVTDVAPDASLPSPSSPPDPVTGVTPVLVSSSLISSGSDLSDARDPPAWFPTALEVIAMSTGVTLPPGEAWLRYAGHRADKAKAISQPDAQYWLTTVMVPEAKEVLRRAARDKDRDAKFDRDKRFAKEGPPKPPPPTKQQAEAFAEELAARMGLKAKVGT